MSTSIRTLLDARAIVVLRKKRIQMCTTQQVLQKDYKGLMTRRQITIVFRKVKELETLEKHDRNAFLLRILPSYLAVHLPDAIAADIVNHKLLEDAYE